jgi:succinyl-CoA synthetase alpha subunit
MQKNVRMIGPGSPGVISPREAKVGTIPDNIVQAGTVGIVSRSRGLAYETLFEMKCEDIGISTYVGLGGSRFPGTTIVEVLQMFENDAGTEKVVMIGEVGGFMEELAADFITHKMSKPVIALISGRSVPVGKQMGHPGAKIDKGIGFVRNKLQMLVESGVVVAKTPDEVPRLLLAE